MYTQGRYELVGAYDLRMEELNPQGQCEPDSPLLTVSMDFTLS